MGPEGRQSEASESMRLTMLVDRREREPVGAVGRAFRHSPYFDGEYVSGCDTRGRQRPGCARQAPSTGDICADDVAIL